MMNTYTAITVPTVTLHEIGIEDGRIQIVNLGHLHSSGDRV
jgi:hypothetical protein